MSEPKTNARSDTDDDAVEAVRRDAQAEADYAAGQIVPHDRVVAWLKSWGTADELPCPEPKAR